MPVLGCGAEMAKLMDVSDQDVSTIEDVIAERLSLGVSQAVAQRQAVDEALAQLAEERTMVMRAIDEQLGKAPANEPAVEPSKTSFLEDIPNENWLQGKVDYAARSPRNSFGVPKMVSITGYFSGNVMIPVRWAKDIPGERGEQANVRQGDLDAIRKILRDTGKMPLTESGKEYVPYIEIGYDGKPFVNEGNHRIMAAAAEGWEYIPAEVRYFDGGQRRAGKFNPDNLIEITERVTGETPRFSNKSQTDTPEFKRWFMGSKVVDAEGKPLVVYHSTNAISWEDKAGFSVFDTGVSELGSHFGTADQANSFGSGDRRRLMPVYLRIKNPLRLQDHGAFDAYSVTPQLEDLGVISDRQGEAIRGLNQVDAIAAMQASIRGVGYDGVVYRNRREGAGAGDNAAADSLNAMSDAEFKKAYPGAKDSYIAFNPEQIKSATGNNGQFDPENPDIRFSNKRATDTPEFKRWSGGAELVPLGETHGFKSGEPVVVEALHGTTNTEVTEFKRHKANVESDWGAGFYASNTPDDVARNYANNDGPDITSRIERLAEQLEQDDEFDGDHGEALRLARAQLSDSAPNTMKLYMRFDNPVVIGGKNETVLDYSEPYNEELDEYEEPTGTLVEFVDAVRDIAPDYNVSGREVERAISKIWEDLDGEEGVKVSDVAKTLKGELVDAYTDDGNSASSEIVRKAIEQIGFDGIIDQSVSSKFRNMKGMTPDTVHFIAFNSTQIKSATGNSGEFDPENPDIRFANKAQSKWRDEAGRWQLAPGQMLWEMMGKASGPLLDRLYLRSASPEVRHAIRKMKLDQQKAMDTTHELVGAMREMSAEERSMISDIIEKEVKAGVTPPASAVQHAAMMNEAFEKQTDELVRLGMLTQEAADRWRGKYLPRYYKTKLAGGSVKDTWADFISGLQMGNRGDALKGIRGKHLRGRGITQSIDASELDDYKAKGWEVRDPDFDPATDSTVYVWRDYTKEEREKMGEIRDAGFRFTLGYMQTQKDIALGRMYESIANNPDMSSRTQPDDSYVQVPDTNVPETGAKRYGKLAGRWVTRNMMSQLSLQQEMESDAIRLYRKALSIWKENKTVLNPVSHMNNFVSNLTMAHLAGVSYWDVGKYSGAIKDFASGKGLLKEAREAGLFLGSMSEEELGKMLPIELQSLVNVQDSKTVTGMKLAHTVLTWGLRRPAGIAYEFGDRFFKYLIYKDARAQGMEPEAAVDYAQKYIFTYDGLPRGARAVRDLAIPFFSYTYKAIPTLAETAMTHPHRMIAPAALMWVASMAAYAIAAGGDDDWMESVEKYLKDAEFRKKADTMQEEEYKLLPEWMKGRTALGSQKTLRLGTDKLTGNPVFLDTSRFIPGGDLFDVTGNSGGVPWLQPLTPSNPLLSMYTAMIANKDVFTGKELVNKDLDTSAEAAAKRADWLWKMAMPAIAINQAHWDRAVNAVAQARGNRELPIPDIIGGNLTGIGKDGMPVQPKYAAMNTVGIKARPLDLEMSEQIQDSQKRKTLRDLEAQLRQARMLNAKGAMSDREFDRRVETIHMKQERIEEGLTVDGNARK